MEIFGLAAQANGSTENGSRTTVGVRQVCLLSSFSNLLKHLPRENASKITMKVVSASRDGLIFHMKLLSIQNGVKRFHTGRSCSNNCHEMEISPHI